MKVLKPRGNLKRQWMSDYNTRVLLVEDEEDAREILEFYLATIFDEVELATNGEEGFDTCLAHQKQNKFFDVIITDIKMPKKDGMTMIEDITKIIPDRNTIPNAVCHGIFIPRTNPYEK